MYECCLDKNTPNSTNTSFPGKKDSLNPDLGKFVFINLLIYYIYIVTQNTIGYSEGFAFGVIIPTC